MQHSQNSSFLCAIFSTIYFSYFSGFFVLFVLKSWLSCFRGSATYHFWYFYNRKQFPNSFIRSNCLQGPYLLILSFWPGPSRTTSTATSGSQSRTSSTATSGSQSVPWYRHQQYQQQQQWQPQTGTHSASVTLNQKTLYWWILAGK